MVQVKGFPILHVYKMSYEFVFS